MNEERPTMEPRPMRPPEEWAAAHGFHNSIGFEVVREGTGNGRCLVRGKIEPRHLNINNVVHGGVYATILDTCMGGAVVSTLHVNEVTATTSLYVEFIRSARLGQVLSAEGVVARRGHHVAFCGGTLTDEKGTLMGNARGTWYIWEVPQKKA
jgi:acyl-CoA thioesterase